MKKKILFLNWKDKYHPQAGGAEVVHQHLMERLVESGYYVTLLTQKYPGSANSDTKDGINIVRVGDNRYTHTFLATFYYWKNFRNKYDFVISCNNTAPYFACLFKGTAKHFAFYHQLAREIWYYETSFPLAQLGYYLLEPVSLFLQSLFNPNVITVSQSTKQDLVRFGFKDKNISIISEGIEIVPVSDLDQTKKFETPTLLSLGAVRHMKRTLDIVKAFEILKEKENSNTTQLILAGDTSGPYGDKVLKHIQTSKYKSSIIVKGRVSKQEKIELMQRSHVLAVTSLKEGWGLVVTEAASQGTPSVVYNVDGLRDSVINNETGFITNHNSPASLADKTLDLLDNHSLYASLQQKALDFAKTITFDKSFSDFLKVIHRGVQ